MPLDRDSEIKLTPSERSQATLLIIEPDLSARNGLKTCLLELGFGNISEAADFQTALKRLGERSFSHIIFCLDEVDLTPVQFVQSALRLQPDVIAIACSIFQSGDVIFDLLKLGAKGFVVRPLRTETVDEVIGLATKSEPLAQMVLDSKDRNLSLASMVLHALDKVCVFIRQSLKGQRNEEDVLLAKRSFRLAAQTAQMFAEGGPFKLLKAFETTLLERAKEPATKLGRLRKKLQKKRDQRLGRL